MVFKFVWKFDSQCLCSLIPRPFFVRLDLNITMDNKIPIGLVEHWCSTKHNLTPKKLKLRANSLLSHCRVHWKKLIIFEVHILRSNFFALLLVSMVYALECRMHQDLPGQGLWGITALAKLSDRSRSLVQPLVLDSLGIIRVLMLATGFLVKIWYRARTV
ncbi:hypothetical protein VNO77_07385 [Canavalia gladiata]|uniref:Uncharacterized protein n=1 Tax=Canavalia gladiata TaxID=3824 RepID=A0AAN9M7K0_CANGL